MKIYDQHVHSEYSYDSKQPIEEYLKKAEELGLEYFILTEHFDPNFTHKGKDLTFDIVKEKEELNTLQKKYPSIKLLQGIEIGYVSTEVSRINQIINDNQFDLINLSIHESGEFDYYLKDSFAIDGINKTLIKYFNQVYESASTIKDYDVLSHIDFGFKTAYLIDNSISINKYESYVSKIMKCIIDNDKTLELNTKVQEYINDEHTRYMLSLYKKLGGKHLTLSSDAHNINRFCSGFPHYLELIKEAGFDHLCYFINRIRYELEI